MAGGLGYKLSLDASTAANFNIHALKMTEVADATMVDLDDESSDSESDFEEVEVSEEDMETISKLESELEANPNLYDKHVEVTSDM